MSMLSFTLGHNIVVSLDKFQYIATQCNSMQHWLEKESFLKSIKKTSFEYNKVKLSYV